MRNRRRRPTKPSVEVNSELFKKLPPNLQHALRKALGRSEETHSSLIPLPAERPQAAPPVVFYGYRDFIARCSVETLLDIVESRRRWYALPVEYRLQTLDRLGWTADDAERWRSYRFPEPRDLTWEEWRASFGARTDPPEPEGTRRSS